MWQETACGQDNNEEITVSKELYVCRILYSYNCLYYSVWAYQKKHGLYYIAT